MAEIVRKGGKVYILPGSKSPAKAGEGLQPVHPTIRPKVANPEVLYHWLPLSDLLGKKTIQFFTKAPDADLKNGNFGVEYIRRKMLIQAIKFDFLPNSVMSYIAPSNAYDFRTAFNAFALGTIRLIVEKQTILEYALHDLFPEIVERAELKDATNDVWKVYHTIKASKFIPFKDLLGVDYKYIEAEELTHVEIELPTPLSVTETSNKEVSGTLKVKTSLLVRPERKIFV